MPQSLSPVGCKTTNAAILFRTVDYINQLKGDIESIDTNLSQLASQVSTLELIIKEYENMSAASSIEPNNLVQCNVVLIYNIFYIGFNSIVEANIFFKNYIHFSLIHLLKVFLFHLSSYF